MYTIKAKYIGSGLFEHKGKLDFFYSLAYIRFHPDQEYFLLVDDNKNIIQCVEV